MSPSNSQQTPPSRRGHVVFAILAAIAIGFILALVVGGRDIHKEQERRAEMREDATTPPPVNIGGPFTLTNQDGQTVTDQNFRGKYMLLTFGYTYCPDVCPTRLQDMSLALDQLGEDAAKVQPVFITIDPARDTQEAVKNYVGLFQGNFAGLTGTPEQVAQVAKEYQVFYRKGEQIDDVDYMMDHTTLIYLMGPDGNFITTFKEGAQPDEIAATLKQKIAAQPTAPTQP